MLLGRAVKIVHVEKNKKESKDVKIYLLLFNRISLCFSTLLLVSLNKKGFHLSIFLSRGAVQ